MKRRKIAAVSLCFGLCVLAVFRITLVAQGLFGTISGVVTDSSGAVMVGAAVKLTHLDTNVMKTLTTNNAGVYNATSLNPGVYRVEASASASKRQSYPP
jgi:Carboxypeptidase regulatory-like domain